MSRFRYDIVGTEASGLTCTSRNSIQHLQSALLLATVIKMVESHFLSVTILYSQEFRTDEQGMSNEYRTDEQGMMNVEV